MFDCRRMIDQPRLLLQAINIFARQKRAAFNSDDVNRRDRGRIEAGAVDGERQNFFKKSRSRFWVLLCKIERKTSKATFAATVRAVPSEAGNGLTPDVRCDFIWDALSSTIPERKGKRLVADPPPPPLFHSCKASRPRESAALRQARTQS